MDKMKLSYKNVNDNKDLYDILIWFLSDYLNFNKFNG